MSRIFIVDDHPVSQLAVKVIATSQGHEVIGTVDNGREAIAALKRGEVDLAVIDIDIPPPNGLDVIKRVRAEGYAGGILVLSAHADRHFIDRARQAGANGYISKLNHLDELADALKAILNGYEFFPKRDIGAPLPTECASEEAQLRLLSNRELEVLGFIARGDMLIDIAEKLHVSNKSISTYKRRIMTKLGLSKTLEMVEFARRHNLV